MTPSKTTQEYTFQYPKRVEVMGESPLVALEIADALAFQYPKRVEVMGECLCQI